MISVKILVVLASLLAFLLISWLSCSILVKLSDLSLVNMANMRSIFYLISLFSKSFMANCYWNVILNWPISALRLAMNSNLSLILSILSASVVVKVSRAS